MVTKTKLTDGIDIIIINTYVPPYNITNSLKEISKIIKKLQTKYKSSTLMVIGDFNLFKTVWTSDIEAAKLIPESTTTRKSEIYVLEEVHK